MRRSVGSLARTHPTNPGCLAGWVRASDPTIPNHDSAVRARSAFAFLHDSDLPRQLDRIKIVPETLSLDELSKLWSVFFQIAHRPSLQYVASAVLLDAEGGPFDNPRRARSAVTA